MAESTELMTVDNICNRVYIIRGQQVMLCAINIIIETSMIHPVIDKLLLAQDKQI